MKHLGCIILLALAAAAPGGVPGPVSREEAALGGEVCMTGVVTCVAHWQKHSFILASPDDPNGEALYVTGEHPDDSSTQLPTGGLALGDIVEVRGKWAPMLFATGIYATKYERLGRMDLPPPPARELHDFAQGLYDNRRAAVSGVVQHSRPMYSGQVELSLATREGLVEARAFMEASAAEKLVDAEATLSCVVMSRFNHRAEFLGIRLEVAEPDGVAVAKPAPGDPFDARATALNAILSWSPRGQDGHRVKVKGTVTLSRSDGVFYLQSADAAIRVMSDDPPPEGVSVEVAGFPAMVDGTGQLRYAVWRETGEPPIDIPVIELPDVAVTNTQLRADVTFVDYDCRKVSIAGRLYGIDREDASGPSIFIDVAGRTVRVNMEGEMPGWIADEAENAPLVRIVGIARFDMSGAAAHGRRPIPNALAIETKGDGGAALVPDSEWRRRKLRRAAKMVLNAIALLPLAFAAAGAVMWRRSVQRRRRRELLAVERRRMADDLHDTIEQHLAGAKILLSTAADKLDADTAAAGRAVKMACAVLAEAKHQIRDVILNLRSDELVSKNAGEFISRIAKDLNDRGIVRVHVKLRGLPESLMPGAKADLVAIVQQAVTNAVNHGGAKNIAIVCDPAGDERPGFRLRILNDGRPFDIAKALGPESGHFGLSNMRERAKRSAMNISWCREGKWTCVKLER